MKAAGMLFMSRTRPIATNAANGPFQLTLLLMDRIASGAVEPWRVTWQGDEARAFWTEHAEALKPGQPINVTATRIRAFKPAPHMAAEVHALVESLSLAPVATHQTQRADKPENETSP